MVFYAVQKKAKLSFLWKLELNVAEQLVYHFFMVCPSNHQTFVKLHLTKKTDPQNSFLTPNILFLSFNVQTKTYAAIRLTERMLLFLQICKYYIYQRYVSTSIKTGKFYLCVCMATLCPYWLLRGMKPCSQITIQKGAA